MSDDCTVSDILNVLTFKQQFSGSYIEDDIPLVTWGTPDGLAFDWM